MSRIPLPSPNTMNPEQKRVYDDIVGGQRGTLVGPLRAALHNPDLADRWQKLGALLRFGTSLPKRVSELAILVTGRRWNSQIEWYIHAKAALEAGIPAAAIEALRVGAAPIFDLSDDALSFEFARQLQMNGQVDLATYQQELSVWGTAGVVELTAVIGYYTMVSMTLNVHEIPMPEGAIAPLKVSVAHGRQQLTDLPPAQ